MKKSFALALCSIAIAVSTGSAATIYGTAAPLTGTLSGTNLITTGNYVGDAVSIDWLITDNLDGTFDYEYTFIGFRQPGISHVILDLTDDAVLPGRPEDPGAVTGALYDGTDPAVLEFGAEGPSPGNPDFPAGTSIVGVKFDETPGTNPMVISFTSNRAPVYGDIYLKGGSSSAAYNRGLLDHSIMDPAAFIARPNGMGGVVPEPSTFALCGISALAGLGVASRRLRRRG